MTAGITRRIFVVGCPRSGTTVLQSLVGAHPRVRAFPESHFFARAAASPRDEAMRHLRRFLDAAGVELPAAAAELSAIEAFVAALDGAALGAGADMWTEKTPRHLHHVDLIAAHVPDVRFVHVLRRGVDAVRSLHRVTREAPERWGGRPRSVGHCVRRWERDVRISLGYARAPAHHLVRYETLVARPEKVAWGLCEFLGVERDRAMLEARAAVAAAVTLPGETWKERAAAPLEASPHTEELPGVVEATAVTQALLDDLLPAEL
jgi:hypothetical protein